MIDRSGKLMALEAALDEMIADNITITARAVVRHIPEVFKNAFAITRDNPERLQVLGDAQKRQRTIRQLKDQLDPKSRGALQKEVATLKERLLRIEAQRDMLIASHRGLFQAVSSQGRKELYRFYSKYADVEKALTKMGALPTTEISENGKGTKE